MLSWLFPVRLPLVASKITFFLGGGMKTTGGGAHTRGRITAAKSRRAPEIGAAHQVHRYPCDPHYAHASASRVETLRLGRTFPLGVASGTGPPPCCYILHIRFLVSIFPKMGGGSVAGEYYMDR